MATCEEDAPVWIESVFFSLGDPSWPEMDRDVAVSFWSNDAMKLFYTAVFRLTAGGIEVMNTESRNSPL